MFRSILLFPIVVFCFLTLSACATQKGPAEVVKIQPLTESVRKEIGSFKTRALWNLVDKNSPTVILIPGSGPHGPESMMPASMTADGSDHALLTPMAVAFQKAGVNTLQLGKPGVEFFSGWTHESMFYNKDMYEKLRRSDLLQNLSDAVEFVKSQALNPRIFVLGHSEGATVAVDFAADKPNISGLILLGFSGENMKTIVEWQVFDRQVDWFVERNVDMDKDGSVSRTEAERWKEFQWPWAPGENSIPVQNIRQTLRMATMQQDVVKAAKATPVFADIWEREPIYKKAAALKMPIYAYSGEFDVQTPITHLLKLKVACAEVGKKQCYVNVLPGLGHGFSPPRAPRAHPLLDLTLGPVNEALLTKLETLGRELREN